MQDLDMRIAERRRARRRRERRRRQIRRIAVFSVSLVAVGAAFLSLGMTVSSTSKCDDAAETPTVTTEHLSVTPQPIQWEPMEVVEEPAEPTIEDMLADGTLTDDISLSYDLQLVAREAAEEFEVPYNLLLAVMFRESSFQTDAVSYTGTCFGLMQVNQINFEWVMEDLAEYDVTDIQNDPRDNIYAGTYILGGLLDKYGDVHKALMCYNCGESGARNLWEQGYTSSQYSREVVQYADELCVSITVS